MCIGHVYIVLEPVGSTCLTFDDDLYYELCDLMTEACSESWMRSRTRRGVSKWSRSKDRYIGRLYSDIGKVPSDSGIFRSTGELRDSPGSIWALLGYTGIEKRGQKEGGARPSSGPNWTRGAAPFSLFLSPSFLLSYYNKGRRSPTPGGSRTPPLARPPPRSAASLPCSFIYGGRRHPIDTAVDH